MDQPPVYRDRMKELISVADADSQTAAIWQSYDNQIAAIEQTHQNNLEQAALKRRTDEAAAHETQVNAQAGARKAWVAGTGNLQVAWVGSVGAAVASRAAADIQDATVTLATDEAAAADTPARTTADAARTRDVALATASGSLNSRFPAQTWLWQRRWIPAIQRIAKGCLPRKASIWCSCSPTTPPPRAWPRTIWPIPVPMPPSNSFFRSKPP